MTIPTKIIIANTLKATKNINRRWQLDKFNHFKVCNVTQKQMFKNRLNNNIRMNSTTRMVNSNSHDKEVI